MPFLILIFFLWRVLDLLIAYIAHLFDKYNEHFLYKFQLYHSNPYIPKFLISFANYDGAHYLHIAHDGYKQYEQAFFPFFPLLIRLLSNIFDNNFFLPGFFLANISFLVGLYFFKQYLESLGKSRSIIRWTLVFLLVFPTSFFFGAVYTEGLFFLLVSLTLYFAQKKQYKLIILFSILASLTRLMGLFLCIPLVTTLLLGETKIHSIGNTMKEKALSLLRYALTHKKVILISLSPLVGLFIYMTYLSLTVHDAFSFYHSLSGFNTGRTIHKFIFLPQVYFRYIHIFLVAPHNISYFVALVEFVTFNMFLLVLLYDVFRLWKSKHSCANISLIGLNIFSLVNLLLPSFTGTLTSLPRYALFSLSFFLRIAEIKSLLVKIALLILFAIFHIVLLTLFIQGYFVS